jgi:DNA-binding NarL/FixJ family response regulator
MLQGILEGKANAEIAADRRTAPRTVANQVARLFKKLGVRSRSELAARHGPIEGET